MIQIPRSYIVEQVKKLPFTNNQEHGNIVGNAQKGHGKYALKVLTKKKLIEIEDSKLLEELNLLFDNSKINMEKYDSLKGNLTPQNKFMTISFLRKIGSIEIIGQEGMS